MHLLIWVVAIRANSAVHTDAWYLSALFAYFCHEILNYLVEFEIE